MQFHKKQKFSIRKLSLGVCSVLVGIALFGAGHALAEENASEPSQVISTVVAKEEPQPEAVAEEAKTNETPAEAGQNAASEAEKQALASEAPAAESKEVITSSEKEVNETPASKETKVVEDLPSQEEKNLKPITQNGSTAQEDMPALVEDKPYLDIQTEEIAFETKEISNPNLEKGQRKVVQVGIKDERTHLIEVSALDGSRKVVESSISKAAVDELIEVGTKELSPDKSVAPTVQPAPATTPLVKDKPSAQQADQKALVTSSGRSASKDAKLPQTGTSPAWPLTVLGALLAVISLGGSKRKKK